MIKNKIIIFLLKYISNMYYFDWMKKIKIILFVNNERIIDR